MKLSIRLTAVLLSLCLLSNAGYAAGKMPEKAFDVEDGVVAVVAGVVPSPAATSALPIGKLKYPTRYFVELRNESPYPLWLDAAWAFPEKGKAVKSKTVRSKKVPSGASYVFYSDKLGVIAAQPIVVDLHAWSEEKRVNLVGSQQATLLFDQADIDVFFASFPSAFKGRTSDDDNSVVISGWRDVPSPRTDIPGTFADATLQTDIQRLLWKDDSRKRWSCNREVVGAAPIDVADSQLLAPQPVETRQQAELEQFGDTLHMERWTIRSCEQDIVYEVMVSASRQGGSDVMILELAAEPGSQNSPEIALAE